MDYIYYIGDYTYTQSKTHGHTHKSVWPFLWGLRIQQDCLGIILISAKEIYSNLNVSIVLDKKYITIWIFINISYKLICILFW